MTDSIDFGGVEVPVRTDCRLAPDTFLIGAVGAEVRYTGDPDKDRWCPQDEPCDVHASWDARDEEEKDLIRLINTEMVGWFDAEVDRVMDEILHGDGTGELRGILDQPGVTPLILHPNDARDMREHWPGVPVVESQFIVPSGPAYDTAAVVAAQDLEWRNRT